MRGSLIRNIVTFPVIFIAVIVDLYLLINGTALFGEQFVSYRSDLELYLMMIGAVAVLQFKTQIPEMNLGIGAVSIGFVPAFLITAFALDNLDATSIIHANSLGAGYLTLQVIFQIFVVAFSEETIFRGYILTYLQRRGIPAPWLWQGILFGLFHYYAYQGLFGYEWYSILTAMVFGSILGLIVFYAQKSGKGALGLGVTWGIHSGWNLALTTGLFAVGGLL